MDKKYPASLFWTNFIISFLFRNVYLSIPCILLLIVGIWVRPCLYIGLGLLLLDFGLSLSTALHSRRVFLTSDEPSFREFQEAVLSDNWQENLHNLVESKLADIDPIEDHSNLNDPLNHIENQDDEK